MRRPFARPVQVHELLGLDPEVPSPRQGRQLSRLRLAIDPEGAPLALSYTRRARSADTRASDS